MCPQSFFAAKKYQWLEAFAGSGMATRCVKKAGYRATHVDILDAQKHALPGPGSVFDILSPSGFAILNSNWKHAFMEPLAIAHPLLSAEAADLDHTAS